MGMGEIKLFPSCHKSTLKMSSALLSCYLGKQLGTGIRYFWLIYHLVSLVVYACIYIVLLVPSLLLFCKRPFVLGKTGALT